jgi:hypothetical protein
MLTAAVALLVALLGFGVLNAFYWAGGWMLPGPGLYDYWASSVGDAVLLPTVFAALTWLNTSGAGKRRDDVLGAVALAIGAAVGIMVQWGWLADPDPVLNWTLPAPGVFTAAGWYHAGFLVATTGILLGGAARSLSRLARRATRPGDQLASIVLAVASIAFAMLLIFDNLSRRPTGAGSTTLVAVIVSVAVVAVIVSVAAVRIRRSAQQLGGPQDPDGAER